MHELDVVLAEGRAHEEQVPMRQDLMDLFELDELKKYYTGEEIIGHRADSAEGTGRGEQA